MVLENFRNFDKYHDICSVKCSNCEFKFNMEKCKIQYQNNIKLIFCSKDCFSSHLFHNVKSEIKDYIINS